MNKKKLVTLAMVFSMIAILAIGGTIAYFTDADYNENVMTLGNVAIDQIEQQRGENGLEEFVDDKPLMPMVDARKDGEEFVDGEYFHKNVNNVVDKIVTVKNTAEAGAINQDTYVRTIIAFETATEYEEGTDTVLRDGKEIFDTYIGTLGDFELLNRDTIVIGGVEYVLAEKVYEEALEPQEVSDPSLKQIFLSDKANNEVMTLFGEEYTILVVSQATQTAGFNSADEALNEAFGDVEEVEDSVMIEWLTKTESKEQSKEEPAA